MHCDCFSDATAAAGSHLSPTCSLGTTEEIRSAAVRATSATHANLINILKFNILKINQTHTHENNIFNNYTTTELR